MVARLEPTVEDRARAREMLLSLLASADRPPGGHGLGRRGGRARGDGGGPGAGPRELLLGLLASQTDPRAATGLADAVAGLAVTAEDRARARETLLSLLASATESWAAADLADAVARLEPTAEDRARARRAAAQPARQPDRPRAATGWRTWWPGWS